MKGGLPWLIEARASGRPAFPCSFLRHQAQSGRNRGGDKIASAQGRWISQFSVSKIQQFPGMYLTLAARS